jgi:hypothetical protein
MPKSSTKEVVTAKAEHIGKLLTDTPPNSPTVERTIRAGESRDNLRISSILLVSFFVHFGRAAIADWSVRPDFVPGIRPYLQMNWIF